MDQQRREFLKTTGLAATGVGVMCILPFDSALADKSSVILGAPESAPKGSEISIKINVSHNANNFLHYTSWLAVSIDGKETATWDYSWRKRPDGNNFTKEITHKVEKDVEITAEANCNLHGSKGPVTLVVRVQK